MPLTISQDGAVVTNHVTQSGTPGVRITGAGVTFTNSESGRVLSTAAGTAALILDGAGAVVTNELGGIISGFLSPGNFLEDIAIRGSAEADVIVNRGLVAGDVELGDGNDSYTDEGSYRLGAGLDLGDGDDLYVYSGTYQYVQSVDGGDGIDTIRLDGIVTAYSNVMTNMERLEIGDVFNVAGFSGFQTVTVDDGAGCYFSQCDNPDAALVVRGLDESPLNPSAIVTFASGTRFASVTCGDFREWIIMEANAAILGNVDMGAGNDQLTLSATNFGIPSIGGIADGGTGFDYIQLIGSQSLVFDMTDFVNFESLNVMSFSPTTASVEVSHADGFQEFVVGPAALVRLVDSVSPDAILRLQGQANVELGADTLIASVLFPIFDAETNPQGDLAQSVSLRNDGGILGDVRFGRGDDLYDGRLGEVGGTVYGYAGNDTLRGGAGVDRFSGGFGADLLVGGLGADVLDGGGGTDTASYADHSAAVTVNLNIGQGFGNHAQGDTYAGIENVIGSSEADFIIGDGNNNRLDGADGDDLLVGSVGADALVGGNGVDTVSYGDNWGAVFINLNTGQGFGNAAQGDTYESIENLAGGIFDDFFIGTLGSNRLDGADGNDTLVGSVGADTLVGGNGTDTASYEENWGGVFANLTLGQGFGNAAQGDTYSGIENLKGSIFDDFFIGDANANRLAGALGADTLVGAGGADSFLFDTALGAGNVDTITDFASGNDKILLDDSVFAGLGLGALAGGAFVVGTAAADGNDRIVYNQATGALLFDADGTGVGAAVQFATLQGAPAITANDFTVI